MEVAVRCGDRTSSSDRTKDDEHLNSGSGSSHLGELCINGATLGDLREFSVPYLGQRRWKVAKEEWKAVYGTLVETRGP
jgi:hypothetical protein